MTRSILIVDDEPVQRRLLENAINRAGYRAVMAQHGEQALDILAGSNSVDIALVVLDLVMPGLDGMAVLERMGQLGLAHPVIVQTSTGGIDTVVGAIRAGAVDFCVKPVSFERLKVSIENALKLGAMEDAVKRVRNSHSGRFTFDDMIAESDVMARVVDLGTRAADTRIPVLLEGESGVGKEVVARAIQGTSSRAGKPFVAVNCGALPENLVESILFGHEKGAFTGATTSHTGKFKEADGGTLFLDEVGELSPDIQVKLLRAIQEGEIDPVGAKRPVKTDFRLISATNRDMIDLVKRGQFREDLYYRLNVFPINIPPLRKRKSDIAPLVRHFIARLCLEEGLRAVSGIKTDVVAMLEAYDWPGNIRQLENTIFRALILCTGNELTIDEFPQIALAVGDAEQSWLPGSTEGEVVRLDATRGESSKSQTDFFVAADGALRSLENIEEQAIRFAISYHGGKMTRVARSLGIGRSTLYRKLKEFGIDPDAPAAGTTDAA